MQSINDAQPSLFLDEYSSSDLKSKSLSSSDIKENHLQSSNEWTKDSSNSNGDNEECLGYKSTYMVKYDQKEEKEPSSSENEKTSLSNENTLFNKEKFSSFFPSSFESSFLLTADNADNVIFPFSYSIFQKEPITFFPTERKISSPICSYYDSSYKFLSKTLDKNIIDYSKSNNFIKKVSLYQNVKQNLTNTQINRNLDQFERKENINQLKTTSFSGVEYSNFSYNKISNANLHFGGIKMQPYSLFMKSNGNGNNKGNNKQQKPFIEREGDWVCGKCGNLNFAFRIKCNRCGLQKNENEKLVENNTKKNGAKGNNSNTLQNNEHKEFNYKYNCTNSLNNSNLSYADSNKNYLKLKI